MSDVAPFTGAWIEMSSSKAAARTVWVAPFTGAWIEIQPGTSTPRPIRVAPFTGAWIEIFVLGWTAWNTASLPSRERGLKCDIPAQRQRQTAGRSLHGSVD